MQKNDISLMEPLIATYKHRKGLSQDAAVARQLGVERTALANYKNGERRIPDSALAILADGLGIPLGDAVAAANIALKRSSAEEEKFWIARIENAQIKKLAESLKKMASD